MKNYYDIMIITPLEEEFQSAIENFTFCEDLTTDNIIIFHVQPKNSKLKVLLVKQNAMGKTANQEAALACLREYDVGIIACVGIAGALSSDMNIGDVCYSGSIIDVLDNQKELENEKEEIDKNFSPTIYETPRELALAITLDRINPITRVDFVEWQTQRGDLSRALVPEEFHGKEGKKERIQDPKIIEGALACGAVSGSPKYNKKIKLIDRKVLAIETESGGSFFVAKQYKIPAITIRGISDYAGVDKNRFEEETNNSARKIAADNAFSFIAYQLGRQKFVTYFDKLRTQRSGEADVLPFGEDQQDILEKALLHLEDVFHERLKDLSPGYSLQPKGYRLPVPRVRVSNQRSGQLDAPSDPLEFRDALKDSRVILLHMPKQYPDASLPYVLANHLARIQQNDRQFVPYVLDGTQIRLPQGTLDRLTNDEILQLKDRQDAQLIFVINDFNFDNPRRVEFLFEQIEKWPSAAFVVITKSQRNLIQESKFTASTSASIAELCDISFIEIAHFLQKNFELTGPASEVIASRLRNTFKNFDLSAHPTYFAGIPRPVLDALLQANRRAELIELAVAGYLSFSVVYDDQSVSLSRTTREKFLTQLAWDMNVQKTYYTEADLVALTATFAAESDYNISPSKFVNSFIERGILHVEGQKIRFSLQFMEAFLLAKKLVHNEQAALNYFKIDNEDFDYSTFSIYAELGPSDKFVKDIQALLDKSILYLDARKDDKSIFAGNIIRPVMLNNYRRLSGLQTRLQKAVEDVRADKDETHEKQKLLDATDKIREKAEKKQDSMKAKSEDERAEKQTVESNALNRWHTAISLLGSGAERLNAPIKRGIIKQLLMLSSLIIEDWTRLIHKIDFAELKEELIKQEDMLEGLSAQAGPAGRREAEKLLSSLVDLMEFTTLMRPFMLVTEQLCENAHHPVLSESIFKTSIDEEHKLGRLLQNIWLSDVETQRGKSALKDSIKSYQNERFLRVALSVHLMMRVYWHHWRREDRLALLDLAQESLKSAGLAYDKAKLAKFVDEDASNKDPLANEIV